MKARQRKLPIPVKRRIIRQKQNNVAGTFRLSRNESRAIPGPDQRDKNEGELEYYFEDDDDLFYENRSDESHIYDDYQNRAMHPANTRRSHIASEVYLYGSYRQSDERHVQVFHRTGMARNCNYNDVSEEAVEQIATDEYRYGIQLIFTATT